MEQVNVPRVSLRGEAALPVRAGLLHPDGGPTGNFRDSDEEYIAITVLPHQWKQFAVATGMPGLETDPRSATPRARRDNSEVLRDLIEAWLQSFSS
jgi:CoA:oxalate CoA-transferase